MDDYFQNLDFKSPLRWGYLQCVKYRQMVDDVEQLREESNKSIQIFEKTFVGMLPQVQRPRPHNLTYMTQSFDFEKRLVPDFVEKNK